jgi:hypothetical protein
MDTNKDILLYLNKYLQSPLENSVLYHLLKAYECIHGTENITLLKRVIERMELGQERYGHGIRLNDDTRQWGTKKNSWMEMCEEEIIDGIIYSIADHLRNN